MSGFAHEYPEDHRELFDSWVDRESVDDRLWLMEALREWQEPAAEKGDSEDA